MLVVNVSTATFDQFRIRIRMSLLSLYGTTKLKVQSFKCIINKINNIKNKLKTKKTCKTINKATSIQTLIKPSNKTHQTLELFNVSWVLYINGIWIKAISESVCFCFQVTSFSDYFWHFCLYWTEWGCTVAQWLALSTCS